MTYSLALPVLAHFWLVSISDEGSLPEITLSDASKSASMLYCLLNRSVHVLYTKIIRYLNSRRSILMNISTDMTGLLKSI